MKIWDYAEMAKAAKKLGGPEKYADFLIQSGRKEMIPLLITLPITTLVIGILGAKFAPKLVESVKKKIERNKLDVQNAKEGLIKELNMYTEKDDENIYEDNDKKGE